MDQDRPLFRLTLEQVEDFDKRRRAFHDWSELHPNATFAELAEAKKRFDPSEPAELAAYKWWCTQEIGRENKMNIPDNPASGRSM